MKHLIFRNGDKIPSLGLGTWKSEEGEAYNAVLSAIQSGFRHIDCAFIYGNQAEIGEAFKAAFDKGLVKREELFVTSKLWNSSHLKNDVKKELQKTLADLQLDYLDLYLVHWPVALTPGTSYPKGGEDFLSYEEAPLEDTWLEMEDAVNEGLIKHIGVSNFNITRLKEISGNASIQPEMNQVEMHPFLPQQKLVDYCFSENILMTAYSPLGSNDRPKRVRKENDPILMEHPVIGEIAKKHDASAAQVLIAWSIRRDIAVIPKSANPDRIKQNFAASELVLSDDDFQQINELDNSFRYIDGSLWTIEGSPFDMSDLWEY